MTTFELREKRAKAWESAKNFLDSHRDERGVLSAEDDATYTRMEAEITALGNEIKRQERREALEAELNAPTSSPIKNKSSKTTSNRGVYQQFLERNAS